ncbi:MULTISPECIES: hypothetical protein [Bacillus]|uniref:hypothetical protein n=1 Tax=Bacillus TaxID=1386 RepID=UPI000BEBC7FC|nr:MULTISPECIES: hypothetical protein [Bacillus]MBJ8063826.1 hypothetical protein [Bacillus cereus group sp. N15]MCS3594974.1 DNA repair exonuclease SbcCD ATPase subunit [Bacillus sp. JUb91]PEB28997.1 hypothetical protein COO14_19015 [Bacillus toyonensis]TBX47824.1 hypothetical protein E0M44_14215 [Bacillus toyonensis]HDR7444353.1 hypothetical protein [Bacillus toyonensis]
MKNLFGGFFKKGNETKLEKLQGEQSKLNESVGKLQAKQARVQNALQLAEVDHELENSTATQKRVNKYVQAIEEVTKEIASLQEQLNAIAEDIAKITAEEEQLRIENLAQQDAQGYEDSNRGVKAKKLMERVNREIDVLTNDLGAGYPTRLVRDIDNSTGESSKFGYVQGSSFQPSHRQESPAHIEAWEKVTKEADAKLDADYAELLEAVEKYFGKKLI